MANESITKVPAQDAYADALTIGPSFYAVKVFVHVDTLDNAICQFAVGDVGNWSWSDREYIVAETLIVKNVIGVRFRNYTPGAPAIVSAYLLTPSDPDFQFAVPLAATGGGGGGGGMTGDIVYSGAAARAGAVLCDGGLYDGTDSTYAGLWAAIGITFGGAGQNSFAVPDLRDRVPIGVGGNTVLGANDGVASANRHNTRHRHTPHTHTVQLAGSVVGGASIRDDGSNPVAVAGRLSAVDGGSGVAGDPVDGSGFLGLKAFILL